MKPVKWTREKVIELSTLYKGPSEFKKSNPSAYKAMRRYGLLQTIYPLQDRERKVKFTEIVLLELMSQCATRTQFQKLHPSAYNAARKLGLINKGIPISNKYKAMGREPYTDVELIIETKKYTTRSEFERESNNAYQVACRRGIVDSHGPDKMGGYSQGELDLLNFLQHISPDFASKRFGVGFELDCYSDSLKIGIEYNGLYWHSEEAGKDRQYHLRKTTHFEALGIRVIHIWEHEWRDRRRQVENYLMSACRVNAFRVGARKCEFKEISSKEAKDFLQEQHIQGAPSIICLSIGVFFNSELISVATFGPHHRRGKKETVLNRFACLPGVTVAGCLAKVSKMALSKLGDLKSWADYSKSQGRGYLAAGWKFEKLLSPDYFYAKGDKVISKQSRKKSVVETPISMTEKQHAKKDGLNRIWDCGKIVLTFKKHT